MEFDDFGDERTLTRAELQTALRVWGLPSGGTNVALRERYRLHRTNSLVTKTSATASSAGASKKSPPAATAAPGVSVATQVTPKQDKGNDNAAAAAAAAATKQGAPVVTSDLKTPPPPTRRKSSDEKRLKRFRPRCPQKICERVERAKTQRMFLVKKDDQPTVDLSCKFVVLGSTGNVYHVTVSKLGHCTCPDYRNGNTLCKHILFVLLKVMAIPSDSYLIYQAAWLESELQGMFDQMNRRYRQVSGAVLANSKVRETFAKLEKGDEDADADTSAAKRQQVQENDDCPICFDALGGDGGGGGGKITFCRARCGANFHQTCIDHWLRQHASKPTCPMCREAWEDGFDKQGLAPVTKQGFTNLGKLQGQTRGRNYSSYSRWSRYSKRRRYWY